MENEKYRRIATIPAYNTCFSLAKNQEEEYSESSVSIGIHELGNDILLVTEFTNNNVVNYGFISVGKYEIDNQKFNACTVDACTRGYTNDSYYFNLPEKLLVMTENKQ